MLAGALLFAACSDDPSEGPAAPGPGATVGPPTPSCVEGWTTPGDETALFQKPLRVIRRTTGERGKWIVDAMRYFEGPESPPSDKGYLLLVKRWYVKGALAKKPSFRGRFLVEEREFGSGLSAVAPYGTMGYFSPDWRGFQYEGANPRRRAYEGLSGKWAGTPYDFVTGGAGLDFPGLPGEVIGCLLGT